MSPSLLLIVVLLVMATGCGTGVKIPPKYEWFFDLPDVARAAAVVGLDPDTQVDLCLLSRYVGHPASPEVCWAVASQGEKVVPAISRRLAADEHPDLQLFDLAHRMHEQGHYNVAADQEFMALLQARSESLVMEYWREITGQQIDEIRRSDWRPATDRQPESP